MYRNLLRSVPAAAVAAVLASLLTVMPNTAHAEGEQGGRLRVISPTAGSTVSDGGMAVRGSVDADSQTGDINVMFAVDVSGSTSSPSGMDCDGDGTADAADNFNADGSWGDVLDCEISGVLAVNAQLRALPGSADTVRIGITAFGSTAQAADMSPTDDSTFVGPGQTGGADGVTPWVSQVLSSLRAGVIGAFTGYNVDSGGTDFDAALSTSIGQLAARAGPKYLFFLSDGLASVSSTQLAALTSAGITARTFAVGTGVGSTACQSSQPLGAIAAAGGGDCTIVTNPANLSAAITEAPSTVQSVTVDAVTAGPEVVAPVQATIDALGNYSAVLPSLPTGHVTLRVVAAFTDGTVETDTVSVFASPDKYTYVALGDSYASGEGIEPYVGQSPESGRASNRDFLCHRSTDSWAHKIKLPGAASTLASQAGSNPSGYGFQFIACSGARTINADTAPQVKEYRDNGEVLIPLQYDALDPAVDLVTVSMGGNDLDFAGVAKHCILHAYCYDDEYLTTGSGRKVTLAQWAEVRLALLSAELEGFYGGIRDRVSPETDVIATTYPRLLSKDFYVDDLCAAVGVEETQWLWNQIDTFAEIVKYRAGRSGLLVADVREKFNGNLACERDGEWLYSLVGNRGTDLDDTGWPLALKNPSAATLHPNTDGAKAYASVVNDAVPTPDQDPPLTAPRAGKVAAGRTPTVGDLEPEIPPLDPQLITNPEAVLAKYPSDVIDAVTTSTIVQVALGRGAAGTPECNAAVTHERVPIVADGFVPSSPASLTVTLVGADGTPTAATPTAVSADAEGVVVSEVTVPAGTATGMSISVAGTNPAGGPALGASSVDLTEAAKCVEAVTAAGYLDLAPAPAPTPVPPGTPPAAPEALGAPKISGVAQVGSTLTATSGTWNGPNDLTYTYQWRSAGALVSAVRGPAFRVRPADAGRPVSVQVLATRSGFAPVSSQQATTMVAKVKSRVRVRTKDAARGRTRVTVRVRALYGVPVVGTVRVSVDGRLVDKGKLRRSDKGVVRLLVPKLRPGKHKITVMFSGSRSVVSSKGATRLRR